VNASTPSAPLPRAELLHVLMLPDFERADRIGEFWSYPESRTFAELLIDCEEDWTLRAVQVGVLRESERDARTRPRRWRRRLLAPLRLGAPQGTRALRFHRQGS
jgi:hypothetical protein